MSRMQLTVERGRGSWWKGHAAYCVKGKKSLYERHAAYCMEGIMVRGRCSLLCEGRENHGLRDIQLTVGGRKNYGVRDMQLTVGRSRGSWCEGHAA